MRRFQMLGGRSAIALALALVTVGVLVAPAAAQGYPWPSTPPGTSGWPGGMGFPGMGGYSPTGWGLGSGGFPGVGYGAGYGTSYGTGYGGYPSAARQPRTAPASAATKHVRLNVGDGVFFPAEISVPLGTMVSWVNEGRAPHTVTAPGVWDSGAIQPGGRWSAIFATPGVFDYVSTLDPNMRGRLIVAAR